MIHKVGVIIQGPLVTFGQGPNRCSGGFDAYSTIKENVKLIGKLQAKHVICTWAPSDQREVRIAGKLKENRLNLLALEVPKFSDPDHRYKHHFAIKAGFDYLMKDDIDFVIKVRSDMLIPEAIFKWLLEQAEKAPDRFVVSELYNDGNIGDFIYSGNVKIFDEFLNSVLKHGSFNIHPSVGADIAFKFFIHKSGITLNPLHLPLWIYYLFFLSRRSRHFSLWRQFVCEHLLVLPEGLWKDIIWRGKRMADVIEGPYLFFYEDIRDGKLEVEKLNLRQALTKYRFQMSSYYGKRINKRLKKLLLNIRSVFSMGKYKIDG